PYWDRGTIADAGAVTFTSGASGIVGPVSQSNSLVGSTAGDQVGSSGVRVLSNGNYVVVSQYFDSGTLADAGAMTFGDGTQGTFGTVTTSNSAIGGTANANLYVVEALDNANQTFIGSFL